MEESEGKKVLCEVRPVPSWREAIRELRWFQKLFEISPLPMCIADQEGATLLRANPAYCEMVGRENLDGVTWLELMWDGSSVQIPADEWTTEGTIVSNVEQRTAGGEWLFVSWIVTRFIDEGQMVAACIGRLVDGPEKDRPEGFKVPRKDYWRDDDNA